MSMARSMSRFCEIGQETWTRSIKFKLQLNEAFASGTMATSTVLFNSPPTILSPCRSCAYCDFPPAWPLTLMLLWRRTRTT